MLTSNAIRMHGWAHVAAFLPLMLYIRAPGVAQSHNGCMQAGAILRRLVGKRTGRFWMNLASTNSLGMLVLSEDV